MKHSINDFKKECDTPWYENQETFTREQVHAIVWSQISIIHNDLNSIIYQHMKEQTIEKGEKLRDRNEEEASIFFYLANPRCVEF